MPHLAPIADMDLNAADKLMQVRYFGAMAAAKVLKKHDLLNPGGSLVLMSGTPYMKPYPNWTAQASVKYVLALFYQSNIEKETDCPVAGPSCL